MKKMLLMMMVCVSLTGCSMTLENVPHDTQMWSEADPFGFLHLRWATNEVVRLDYENRFRLDITNLVAGAGIEIQRPTERAVLVSAAASGMTSNDVKNIVGGMGAVTNNQLSARLQQGLNVGLASGFLTPQATLTPSALTVNATAGGGTTYGADSVAWRANNLGSAGLNMLFPLDAAVYPPVTQTLATREWVRDNTPGFTEADPVALPVAVAAGDLAAAAWQLALTNAPPGMTADGVAGVVTGMGVVTNHQAETPLRSVLVRRGEPPLKPEPVAVPDGGIVLADYEGGMLKATLSRTGMTVDNAMLGVAGAYSWDRMSVGDAALDSNGLSFAYPASYFRIGLSGIEGFREGVFSLDYPMEKGVVATREWVDGVREELHGALRSANSEHDWKFLEGTASGTFSASLRMGYWPVATVTSTAFSNWLLSPTILYPKMDFQVWNGISAPSHFVIRAQIYCDVTLKSTGVRTGHDRTLYLTPSGFEATLPATSSGAFTSDGTVTQVLAADIFSAVLDSLGLPQELYAVEIGSVTWGAALLAGTSGNANPRIQFRRSPGT